jgi:hypothetical protein
MDNIVLLPDPDGPITSVSSPGKMASELSLITCK